METHCAKEIKSALECALLLSKDAEHPMQLSMEGVGNFNISHDMVVLVNRDGEAKQVTDDNIDIRFLELLI